MTDTFQKPVSFVANPTAATSHEVKSRSTVYTLLWYAVFIASLASVAGLAYVNSLFAYNVGARGGAKVLLLFCGLIAAAITPGISIAWPYVIPRRPQLWWPGLALWAFGAALSTAAMAFFIYSLNAPEPMRSSGETMAATAQSCRLDDVSCIKAGPCWYDLACLDKAITVISEQGYKASRRELAQKDINILDARMSKLEKHPEPIPFPVKQKEGQYEASGWQGGSLLASMLAGLIIIIAASFLPQFGGEALIAFAQDGNSVPSMTTVAPPAYAAPVAPAETDEIQQMFDVWKERLQWGSTLSTRAQALYDDFRNTCMRAGKPCWTTSSGTTPPRFGEAMAPLLRVKRATVDTSNGTIYNGVGLPGAKA